MRPANGPPRLLYELTSNSGQRSFKLHTRRSSRCLTSLSTKRDSTKSSRPLSVASPKRRSSPGAIRAPVPNAIPSRQATHAERRIPDARHAADVAVRPPRMSTRISQRVIPEAQMAVPRQIATSGTWTASPWALDKVRTIPGPVACESHTYPALHGRMAGVLRGCLGGTLWARRSWPSWCPDRRSGASAAVLAGALSIP